MIILDFSWARAYAPEIGEENLFSKEGKMGKRQILRNGIVLAAIFAVAVFASSGSVMAASKNCSNLGTWHGVVDSGATYMVTITRGQSATVGQFVAEWVLWDPTLNQAFPTAVRTTNPLGVWEKVNGKEFTFTWIAYGLDGNGAPLYTIRASGISLLVNCDELHLTYVTEVFSPLDISMESPIATFCGSGTETRMQLVQATCPQ